MSRRYFLLLVACLGLAISCRKSQRAPATGMSDFVKNYLLHMIDVMKTNSINRKTIDWNLFRDSVLQAGEFAGAQKLADAEGAIRTALTMLHDNHSFYVNASGTKLNAYYNTLPPVTSPAPGVPPLPATIGYVQIPAFSGASSSTEAIAFAQKVQDSIRARDNDQVKGWIVDLRDNGGGNMWPMLAGIGPVLGNGIAGYFIDLDNLRYAWSYANGKSIGENVAVTTLTNPYILRKQDPKVAVLTNVATASSGEVMVISFRERPGTRSFGQLTRGLTSANVNYDLGENTTLVLATSHMADRTGRIYANRIEPDVLDLNADSSVPKAVRWLLE